MTDHTQMSRRWNFDSIGWAIIEWVAAFLCGMLVGALLMLWVLGVAS